MKIGNRLITIEKIEKNTEEVVEEEIKEETTMDKGFFRRNWKKILVGVGVGLGAIGAKMAYDANKATDDDFDDFDSEYVGSDESAIDSEDSANSDES